MKNLAIVFLISLILTPCLGLEPTGTLSLFLVLGAASLLLGEVKKEQGGLAFDTVIPVQDAQGLFTKKMVAFYKEMPQVMSFLRSFFTVSESMTKEVSIAVRRGSERVAVDVYRYSDGNRNTFDKSTEKLFVPPFYHEYLSANEHRLYDQVITALSEGNTTYFAEMTRELAEDLMELQKKIERATELQCSQVFETGIITLNAGTNINFQRKAGSLVDLGAGNYWATGTVNPYDTLEAGCVFIRTKGKAQGTVFNAILGSEALSDLLNNTIFKERQDLKNMALDSVRAPQRDSVGATFHGEITCGSYKVRLWAYPEYYEDSTGTSIPYVNPKKVILLPEAPKFVLAYAAVPQLIQDGKIPQKGAYLIQEFLDEKKGSHEIHIKSAPVAVPVAIDQIYTVQVVAS